MLKYLRTYWFFALLAPLFMIGEVMMDLWQPRLMRIIVDEGVLGLSSGGASDMSIILSTGLTMVGAVALGGLFGVLSGVFANLCSQNFGNDVRKDCFRRIMALSFQQTDAFTTGTLITRVTNDVTQVQNFVAQCIRGFVRTGMLFCGGVYYMLALDLSFGVVLACALPVVLISVVFFISKANPSFTQLQEKLDRVNSVMQENVGGARVVKAYVKEAYEEKRFKGANDALVSTQLRVLKLFAYMSPITNIALNLSVVAVIKIGGIRVEAGALTPGAVMAAITYISQIMHGVMMLAMIFQTASRGMISARRLREVLQTEPAFVGGTASLPENLKGQIEFRDVSFAYPQGNGEMILKNISLTIRPGETLGLLGATGSGKTSLIGLIPRFYDATSGTVLLDGVDVRELPLTLLRSRVAVALQRSELFGASIRENLLWGKPDATEDEVREAARIAQAEGFIGERAEGFEAQIAERGTNLSGGQKQRLAIARAVLKESEVLIFDDSTSALDLKTEAALTRALNERYAGKTKIIIAQRIASVQNADRIAVLDDGALAACGTHDELMASSEIYRDICQSQLRNGGEGHE